MTRRTRALACLTVFLGFAIPGAAQDPTRRPPTETAPRTYSIRGMLRFSDDEGAAEMVKIELKRFTGEVVAVGFTRGNGNFEFGGVTNGQYQLEVNVEGYEPIRERIEVMNSARHGVYLFLRRAVTFTETYSAAVSARELAIPRKASSAFRKGEDRLYGKQDAAGSLKHFEKALAEYPDYYEAHQQMGVAYLEMQRHDDALAAFRRAVEVSEDHYAEPHFGIASVMSTRSQFETAEKEARRGLEINPEAWQGYYQLARCFFGRNLVDEAEKNVRQAIQRKTDFPELYLLAANIHIRKGNGDAVLWDLEQFLKLRPDGPRSDQARQIRQALLQRASQARPTVPPKP